MAKKEWLSLTDYSTKYDVSLSTLRRRIKSERAEYDFQKGKYYLLDQPLGLHRPKEKTDPAPTSQELDNQAASSRGAAESPKPVKKEKPKTQAKTKKAQAAKEKSTENGTALKAANGMLDEIKRAYSLVLQEKEEQILHLREEVADLKTLVRVLEDENERLKTNAREAAPIDSWLKDLDN